MIVERDPSGLHWSDRPYPLGDVLRPVDDVLAGKSKSEEITGNSTNVVFQKDITTIENLFLEGEPAFCEISTYELRSLMDVWLQKCVES